MDDDLRSRLTNVAARRGGHFHVRPSESPEEPRAAADKLALSFRFRAIGEAWEFLYPAHASRTLARLLHQWQAHSSEFMPADEAQALAERFVGSFGYDPICLTNINWFKEKPGKTLDAADLPFSWMPITESTFDAGVVCFGGGQVGMLWFEEGD